MALGNHKVTSATQSYKTLTGLHKIQPVMDGTDPCLTLPEDKDSTKKDKTERSYDIVQKLNTL